MMTLMIMAGECKRQRCNDHLLAGWGRAGSTSCKVFSPEMTFLTFLTFLSNLSHQPNSQIAKCLYDSNKKLTKHDILEKRGVGHSSQKLVHEINF